jgi:sugar phosphate isomerase/epimerase
MRPVLGDGHCLYRAIAFDLTALGLPDIGGFPAIRRRIADELRAYTEKYFDFSCCEDADHYARHCDAVERTAEWGDELELAAAANAFHVTFVVHENGTEPKTWGDFALRTNLALLRYHTTSGGHYNPVTTV